MRLAIISDIHEDNKSLKKVLEKVSRAGYDQLVCLGDISGFSIPHYTNLKDRNAHDCLNLLREKSSIMVAGNHDYHAAKKIPENSNVFKFPDDWYDLDHSQRRNLVGDEIWLNEENELDPLYTKEDIEYLNSLPEYLVLKNEACNILFSHYVYPNLAGFKKGFYTTGKEFEQHFGYMDTLKCGISFTGHTHVNGFYTVTPGKFKQFRFTKTVLQQFPVSVGVPPVANNSKRRGFCIFDTESSILTAHRA
ncbi:MAG: metallophosphoesterase family protein [Bacteroidales bacterium]|nr:metallophosphoesterase family protein [Bacteroidales bacterium]